MSTHVPRFYSYFSFFSSFCYSQISHQQHKGKQKIFEKHFNTDCHVGSPWIALVEYSQMSTHGPGFQSYFSFMHHFVTAKLATSGIRVNEKIF